ncbi:MAG: M15 family metallopeptidase [Sandaracinaceae bacterium]
MVPALLYLAVMVGGVGWAAAQPRAESSQPELPPMCSGLNRANRQGQFIGRADLMRPSSGVDGDDLLALVNRTPTGALPPEYAPEDLIDLATQRPARWWECTPPRMQCLRREAAEAYRTLAAAMQADGLRPHVSSAFRAYRVQCTTFLRWAGRERDGYCTASAASALPGHSQHQLGTTFDVFTRTWMEGGNKFRRGYGCSPGGRWLAEHGHEHGFVLPYPLHPDYREPEGACAARRGLEEAIDPRTGYRFEPWHLRYIGVDNAARFRQASRAAEAAGQVITLEQWLRAESGDADRVAAPVCDGCNCDRCATFEDGPRAPCETPALRLSPDGTARRPASRPQLREARLEREGETLLLIAQVEVMPNTLTQPPVVTAASGAHFQRGGREARLPDRAARPFPQLDGAFRLGVGFDTRADWPWRAALVRARRDGTPNGLNAPMVAAPGMLELRVPLRGVAPGTTVRVAVVRGEDAHDARTLTAP